MAYKWCVVPQCTNTSIKSPNKLFVSVPTNPNRRKMWLQLARRDPKSIGMHSNVFMCEDHFDMEKDTKNYMKYKMGFSQKILLADEAVPTKFHCQEDRKRRLPGAAPSRKVFLKRQRTELLAECMQSQSAIETNAESLQKDDGMTQKAIEPEGLNERAAIKKQTSTSKTTGDQASQLIDTGPLCLTAETSTTIKEIVQPGIEAVDCVDNGASVVEDSFKVEFEADEDYNIQNIGLTEESSTTNKEIVQPGIEAVDCVDNEPSVVEDSFKVEFEADEDYNIQNIAPSQMAISDIKDEPDLNDSCNVTTAVHQHFTTASKEKDNYKKYWQSKLSHIVHSTQFCGVCLSTDDDVSSVYDQFEIVVCERSHATTLADILRVVFTKTENLLSSSHICNNCTNKLIQSYMFIQQARETSRILNCHIKDLYNKTCYLNNSALKEMNQEQPDVKRALISLENYDNIDPLYNIYTTEQKKTVEKKLKRPKLKRKFKCLRCNIYLPSYKAWMIHEISTHHRNKKYSTTQSNLSKANVETTRVLRRCKICHRIIENGGFIDHMKKYHGQSRVCSICNVSFSSFKDFVSHKDEWHYRADSKCLTCLKSYSEVELEQHQCRFGCGSCAEVPCLHHKYLMCYREQILKGALRAKCLDCNYVCRTKTALLKHVNLCHLKHRPKI